MFGLDEKILSDNRTLITIQKSLQDIDPNVKNGTINYVGVNDSFYITTPKIRKAYIDKEDYTSIIDKLLIARNGTTVTDSLTFTDKQTFNDNVEILQDIIIHGNISILGEASNVFTKDLIIEDNLIELNRSETGHGVTLQKAGIAINRGLKGFARSLYDESKKGFVFDNSISIEDPIDNDSWLMYIYNDIHDIYRAGDVRIKRKLYAPLIEATDSMNIANTLTAKDLTVNNNANIKNNLTVDVNTLIKGLLTVEDQSTFNNTVNINHALLVTGNIVSNSKITSSSFEAKDVAITSSLITNLLTSNGAALLKGILTVNENSSFKKDITVDNLITTKDINISNNATITNKVSANNFTANAGATYGYGFWGDDSKYRIYMAPYSYADGGRLDSTSDHNMYFKIDNNIGTNRGFVFKNENTILAQIDGSGILRVKDSIYSKNSEVLTIAHMGHGQNLDADTIDSIHANQFLRSDIDSESKGWLTFSTEGKGIKLFTDGSMIYKKALSGLKIRTNNAVNYGIGFEDSDGAEFFTIKNELINGLSFKGKKVFHTGNMGHGSSLNADKLDDKELTDFLLLDGTQPMKNNLNMSTYKILWNNDDWLEYSDEDLTINDIIYNGKFKFISDLDVNKSLLEIGGLNIGNMHFANDNKIYGVSHISGQLGNAFKFTDSWLRINDDSKYTSGVFFGDSLVRTDGQFHVGLNGSVLKVSNTEFKFNEKDVSLKGHSHDINEIVLSNEDIFNILGYIPVKKYSSNIGNGTDTEFVVNHKLNTRDLTFAIEEMSTGQIVLVDIEKVDLNNIKIIFDTPPTIDQYRITITG